MLHNTIQVLQKTWSEKTKCKLQEWSWGVSEARSMPERYYKQYCDKYLVHNVYCLILTNNARLFSRNVDTVLTAIITIWEWLFTSETHYHWCFSLNIKSALKSFLRRLILHFPNYLWSWASFQLLVLLIFQVFELLVRNCTYFFLLNFFLIELLVAFDTFWI